MSVVICLRSSFKAITIYMAAWEVGFISDCGSDMFCLDIVLFVYLDCQFISSQRQGFFCSLLHPG